MRKWLPVLVIVGLIFILGMYLANLNNKLVGLEENVSAQWGNVESSYQRRSDLIPNIVNTAKAYAKYEQETFTKVIEARSKATSITIDPSNITPQQLEQFQEVQSGLTSALSRLLAVFERYPDLQANDNFKELINELERTENRINVERNKYNEKARAFNTVAKQIPAKFFKGMLGFDDKTYFEAEEGADKAPVIDSNFDI